MFCELCQRTLRADESFQRLTITAQSAEHGVYVVANQSVCPACYAEQRGETYEPRVYPVGSPIPKIPNSLNGDIPICGVCRRARRWDDEPLHIRIAVEDTAEPAWDTYCLTMAEVSTLHANAIRQAANVFQEHSKPFADAREADCAHADRWFEESLQTAIIEADSEATYLAREMTLRAEHERRLQGAHQLYEGQTRGAAAARDSAIQQADFAYRQAAARTYHGLRDQFAQRNCLEPGGYHACSECCAKYVPRIVERLRRNGLVRASAGENVPRDMLH